MCLKKGSPRLSWLRVQWPKFDEIFRSHLYTGWLHGCALLDLWTFKSPSFLHNTLANSDLKEGRSQAKPLHVSGNETFSYAWLFICFKLFAFKHAKCVRGNYRPTLIIQENLISYLLWVAFFAHPLVAGRRLYTRREIRPPNTSSTSVRFVFSDGDLFVYVVVCFCYVNHSLFLWRCSVREEFVGLFRVHKTA